MKTQHYNNLNGNGSVVIYYDGTIEWLEILGNKICLNIEGPHQNFPNSYFIKTDQSSNFINKILKQIEFDFLTESDLINQKNPIISNFLKYFQKGNYYIEYGNYELGEFHLPYKSKDYELVERDFSDFRLPLMCTLFKSDLNFDIIENYKVEIKKGLKPLILSFRKDFGNETGCSFLLDGHHKLMAYNALLTKPNVLEIVLNSKESYDSTNQDLAKYTKIID